MKVYYDKDADLSLIKGKKVTIVGYGSQGHAHALNLHDSGMKVTVGLRKSGASWDKAKKSRAQGGGSRRSRQGRRLRHDADAGRAHRRDSTTTRSNPTSRRARRWLSRTASTFITARCAARRPRRGDDRAQGAGPHRALDLHPGGGTPMLIAVHQNPSRKARDLALSYAAAIGGARAGVIETTFKEETETDLFGEQAVLCGGCVELVKAGFETLVDAGYAPEMAYFECLHELKLIVDLMYEGGIATMNYSISNNAEYGEYLTGPKIVNDADQAGHARGPEDIQTGEYAKSFILENRAGAPTLLSRAPPDRRTPDRGGGRETAGDDAVDQEEQAGGSVQELSRAKRPRRRRTDRHFAELSSPTHRPGGLALPGARWPCW